MHRIGLAQDKEISLGTLQSELLTRLGTHSHYNTELVMKWEKLKGIEARFGDLVNELAGNLSDEEYLEDAREDGQDYIQDQQLDQQLDQQ